MTNRPILNARRLRVTREAQGLSQTSLANLAGISRGHLNDLEAGRRPHVSAGVLWELSEVLGIPFGGLLDYPRTIASMLVPPSFPATPPVEETP